MPQMKTRYLLQHEFMQLVHNLDEDDFWLFFFEGLEDDFIYQVDDEVILEAAPMTENKNTTPWRVTYNPREITIPQATLH